MAAGMSSTIITKRSGSRRMAEAVTSTSCITTPDIRITGLTTVVPLTVTTVSAGS